MHSKCTVRRCRAARDSRRGCSDIMKRRLVILGALMAAAAISCHRSAAPQIQSFSPAIAALIQNSSCVFVGNLLWINPISQVQREPRDIAHFRVTEVLKGAQATNAEIEIRFHLHAIHEKSWSVPFEKGQARKVDDSRYVVFLQKRPFDGRTYRLTDLYLGVLVFDDSLRQYVNVMEKSQ
jgi:hypothetical protein